MQEIRVSPGSEVILRIDHFPQGNYFLIFSRDDGVIVGERFVILRGGVIIKFVTVSGF